MLSSMKLQYAIRLVPSTNWKRNRFTFSMNCNKKKEANHFWNLIALISASSGKFRVFYDSKQHNNGSYTRLNVDAIVIEPS